MMERDRITRRGFLKRSAASAASLAITTLTASCAARAQEANDRLRIGLIGCGGRGNSLIGELHGLPATVNAEVMALCDTWQVNLGSTAAKVEGWLGRKPLTFQRFEELLAQKDVDAVIIATPDFAHSPILAAAARAGKDAYCEKPMATRLDDANDAVDAVVQNKRVVQIGTQYRSDGKHIGAAELIRSGVLGTISKVDVTYHRNTPSWLRGDWKNVREQDVDWKRYLVELPDRPFDSKRYREWHLFKDYTNGLPGLLGAHRIDLIHWWMDDPLPRRCVALGGTYVWKEDREHADTIDVLYEYPKGFLGRYTTRLGNDYPEPDAIFFGTNGTFSTSGPTAWKATGAGGAGEKKIKEDIPVPAKPGVNHIQNWLECIRTRGTPNASVHAGYGHSIAAIMAFAALETGERQVFDSEKREISPG